jgi:sulfonate transport system permease protein
MNNHAEALTRGKDSRSIAADASLTPNKYKEQINTLILGAVLPVVLLVSWQILGDLGYVSTLLFPTPLRIMNAFTKLAASGELAENFNISVFRAFSGFLLGGGLGLLFGALVGLYRKSERSVWFRI